MSTQLDSFLGKGESGLTFYLCTPVDCNAMPFTDIIAYVSVTRKAQKQDNLNVPGGVVASSDTVGPLPMMFAAVTLKL